MKNTEPSKFLFENDYCLFDSTNFPHLYMKFKIENPDKKEFYEYLDCMNKILLHDKKYIVLVELNGSEYLKAEFRKRLAEWNDEHHEILKKYCKGVAYISHSEEQRTMLKIILDGYVLPHPVVVTDTQEKAENWLANRI